VTAADHQTAVLSGQPVAIDLSGRTQYLYRGNNGGTGAEFAEHMVGPYKIVGLARNPVTSAEVIVYQAVAGGQLWCVSLWDFAVKLVPVETAEPTLEKAAGIVSEPWRTGA
jgi:hypothetical protein